MELGLGYFSAFLLEGLLWSLEKEGQRLRANLMFIIYFILFLFS
jgi:hypothetical protein